ncbi:LIM homeobox transcription factor 1-alpha isoform X2 [Anthonomus grandis grandis]|uniref:LIM homeobox transcription factor 1-alpha isoform X2 n=2 Tax=Anthonomus grandis grandis TaxID=2921223 RepID=UPI002164FC7E|nr:LIM homeobox transcription factor 1-alpha isoform X2 [Anthonomus grandis grandis]
MASANLSLCGMCCRPINDRFLLRIMDVSYHEQCVQCCSCGDRLHHTCFVKDSKLYCRFDYDRLFIKKCLGCSERVSPEELVMRASDNIFHLRCFICVVCGIRLQKGDLYVIKQGQLFCRTDYEKEVEMMQGFGYGEYICDDVIPTNRSHDGRRGPKRPRTILTTQQRRAFKASFEVSPKPCRKVREALAKDTGLSVRIVQVWFQNQRAKMKKMQKKARQDPKGAKDPDEKEKLSVKEEEPSPHSTPFFNDSCSDTETNGEENMLQSQENSQFPHIKEEIENDNFFYKRNSNVPLHSFSGLDLKRRDENYLVPPFPNSLDSTNNPIFMLSAQSSQHTHSGLNPIDRLYSMQNSYFCSEDSEP